MNPYLAPVLGRCLLISIVVLLAWLLMIVFAHDWIFQFHTQWFDISRNQFDVIHYAGMAFFKLLFLTLFGIPWVALKMGGK